MENQNSDNTEEKPKRFKLEIIKLYTVLSTSILTLTQTAHNLPRRVIDANATGLFYNEKSSLLELVGISFWYCMIYIIDSITEQILIVSLVESIKNEAKSIAISSSSAKEVGNISYRMVMQNYPLLRADILERYAHRPAYPKEDEHPTVKSLISHLGKLKEILPMQALYVLYHVHRLLEMTDDRAELLAEFQVAVESIEYTTRYLSLYRPMADEGMLMTSCLSRLPNVLIALIVSYGWLDVMDDQNEEAIINRIIKF